MGYQKIGNVIFIKINQVNCNFFFVGANSCFNCIFAMQLLKAGLHLNLKLFYLSSLINKQTKTSNYLRNLFTRVAIHLPWNPAPFHRGFFYTRFFGSLIPCRFWIWVPAIETEVQMGDLWRHKPHYEGKNIQNFNFIIETTD